MALPERPGPCAEVHARDAKSPTGVKPAKPGALESSCLCHLGLHLLLDHRVSPIQMGRPLL
ncbi:unnamed protein product [Arabis nemorensis]|uniref:Uncharacterized protein n=1 Tax=Arabis nemorensis TaxID=586526 RepID=A0A565BR41_9BRAS|nr:unnamed protein product [Arabis nemorensis]